MSTGVRESGLESGLLDSPELRRRLPTLPEAVDPQAMHERLQRLPTLAGGVERCRPVKVLVGSDSCLLRYETWVRGRDDASRRVLLLARVLATPRAAAAYQARAARLASGATWVARIDELNLVLHPFPLDPALPTLRAAVAEDTVLPVLRRLVDGDVDAAAVEVVEYPRQDRCVLRYRLDGHGRTRWVYGKVYADDTGARAVSVLAAVHARLRHARDPLAVQVPRPLDYHPPMRLAVTARVPGAAAPLADRGRRERLVSTAGSVAALLHGIGPRLPRRRTLAGELVRLDAELSAVGALWPDVAGECGRWARRLHAAAAATASAPAAAPRFGHGDLTPAQFLFAGPAVAVVDFDDAAAAEPALDLGRFLAHLRLGLARHDAARDADRLGALLIAAYRDASRRGHFGGHAAPISAALPHRVALCSSLSLLGSALRGCRQLKTTRVARALAALSEEAACLS